MPDANGSQAVLEVSGLKKNFAIRTGLLQRAGGNVPGLRGQLPVAAAQFLPAEPELLEPVDAQLGQQVERDHGGIVDVRVEQVLFDEANLIGDAGLTVPDARTAVTVRVEGAGRLVGLDTGDLDYGGLFKVDNRVAYQGRLLATVQRTEGAGEVRITVTAPGLPTVKWTM